MDVFILSIVLIELASPSLGNLEQGVISFSLSSSSYVSFSASGVASPLVSPTPSPTPTTLSPTAAVDPCLPNPCLNGNCKKSVNGAAAECLCSKGWHGKTCNETTRSFRVSLEIAVARVTYDLNVTASSGGIVKQLILDTGSSAFKEAEASLCYTVAQSLARVVDDSGRQLYAVSDLRCYVLNFYFASIHANFVIEILNSTRPDLNQNAVEKLTQQNVSNGVEPVTLFRLGASKPQVSDLDECSFAGSSFCHPSAFCINTPNSYYCSCRNGETLVDKSRCVNITSPSPPKIPSGSASLTIILPVVFGGLIVMISFLLCVKAYRRRSNLYFPRRVEAENYVDRTTRAFPRLLTMPRARPSAGQEAYLNFKRDTSQTVSRFSELGSDGIS